MDLNDHISSILMRLTQPHDTWWFTPAEQRLARVRLAEDTGEADEDGVNDTYAKSFTEQLEILIFERPTEHCAG